MADFALGLAKTAVEGTLSRVQSAIDEEDKQKKAVQQDLVFITGEFQMMQSFLNIASKERARNEVVRTWVRQLRDLAFDVEDCVEFVIHLDNDSAMTWVWRLVPSCIAPPRTRELDNAVADLKQLKARVEEVSRRNTRYNVISDSASNPVSQSPAEQLATTGPSTIDILMELWVANGKHRGLCNLQKLITNEGNDLQVISLWGSAGSDIEGAQIINKAYCDPEICHRFKSRAWVKVMHPFNPDEILKNLQARLQASSRSCHVVDLKGRNSEDDPMKQLIEQRYLVILEGISSVVEWEIIRMNLPDNNNGSRIVMSTKQIGDAIFFTGGPYRVSVLTEFTGGHYLCAFYKKACDYYGYGDNMEASRSMFLSNRMKEPDYMRSQKEAKTKIYAISKRTGITSVWGIAGVGKSSLVRHTVQGHFFHVPGRLAWVDVPSGPFDLVEFSRLLLLDYHRCDREAMEATAIGIMQGQDPIQGCREILRQYKNLVIIDGLRSTRDWDLIETAFLSEPDRKAKIVVITTEESIAKHSVKQQADRMINVKCLEDDEAYVLFKKIIDPKELDMVNEKVDLPKLVAKCGGLPKIVSAISEVSSSLLQHMNDDFMVKLETDPQFHSLSGLLSWMHSYFDACSDLVKPCIFYLSVFPASSKIRRGRLERRWIAEGYSRDTPGCTARENAQRRFSELVELSIIQQATSKVICQVNGFFREYIISRPMEDNLVFTLDGRCSPNTQRIGQHLTLMAGWHRDQNVFESIDFARLRSLTVFGEWSSFFISDKMRRLRVLDLEDMIALTNEDIEQIFVKLLSLKFISLRGCRKISRLPDTLGGLRQLQTLDVRLTSIVMLPSAIIKLHKLQYIRAGTIALPDEDWVSASSEDGDGVTSQLPVAKSTELEGSDSRIPEGRPIAPTSPENCIAESPALAATSPELEESDRSISSGRPKAPTSPENDIVESPAQAATSPEAQHRHVKPKMRWAPKLSRTSIVPRLPKLPPVTWSLCGSEREREARHHTSAVEVPVGIETLVALHTVGVVNVNATGGEAFLKQFAKLTQLLKLRVCGINKKNCQLLCSALSIHGHLESLSVRFDENCLDDSFKPPETLKSLKLYGPIMGLPNTIKDLVNLKKLDLEITITMPDDMLFLLEARLPHAGILNRLCINLQGDHKLDFSSDEFEFGGFYRSLKPRVVKMDCRSKLEVTIGNNIFCSAEVLIIQCSKGSSFRFRNGLITFRHLKTVWLKGSYSKEQRQYLKELIDGHDNKAIVLKLGPLQ